MNFLPDSAVERPPLLLVEDDPWMRAVVFDILSEFWDVTTARDGAEALRILEEFMPVAVVSDLIMPGIDGLMLCERIRADARLAHLPVMLLSANDAGDLRASALATVDEFLVKPVHHAELVVRLRKLAARNPLHPPKPLVQPPPSAGSSASRTSIPPVSGGPVHHRAFQQRVEAAIHAALADALYTVDDLARDLGVSPRQLRRRLLDLGPLGPKAYIRQVRLEAARQALEVGTFRSVAEVAASVGMTPAYFSRAYRAWTGSAPSRRGEAEAPPEPDQATLTSVCSD